MTMTTQEAAARLESLGSPSRLQIFRELVKAGSPGLAVGDLQKRLGIPGSTLSHHLHQLIEQTLVSQDREGRVLRCRANFVTMRGLVSYLVDECCRDEDGC